MTYMSHNDVYENGIHELSLDEIFQVSGGPGPVGPIVVGVAVGTGIVGGVILVGVAVSAISGLLDGLSGNKPAVQ